MLSTGKTGSRVSAWSLAWLQNLLGARARIVLLFVLSRSKAWSLSVHTTHCSVQHHLQVQVQQHLQVQVQQHLQVQVQSETKESQEKSPKKKKNGGYGIVQLQTEDATATVDAEKRIVQLQLQRAATIHSVHRGLGSGMFHFFPTDDEFHKWRGRELERDKEVVVRRGRGDHQHQVVPVQQQHLQVKWR